MARTDEGNLVEAARGGDSQAFGRLFDAWFDRVHDLSRRIVKDPGTAAEVAQDAFLSAWTRLDTLEDPDAFGGWLLRIARNASLNRLAKERRSVALDQDTMTTLSDHDAPDHDPLAHMDQAARIDLVWDAAAALGERDMSVLDLHLRHGLGAPELAEELGTTPNNAHQILFTLRKRLGTNVRALVLWRAGRPACNELRRTLAASGTHTFDKQAVKVIDRHAAVCDRCSEERSERLAPAALFGAAPVVAAPVLLKARTASALDAAGVPMGGSTWTGASLDGGPTDGSAGSSGTGDGPSGGPDEASPPGGEPAGARGDGHGDCGGGGGTGGGTGSSSGPGAAAAPPPYGSGGGHVVAAVTTGGTGDAVATATHEVVIDPAPGPEDGYAPRRARVLATVVAAVVLIGLAIALTVALGGGDPDDEVAAGATTSTAGAAAPTDADATTTTTGPAPTPTPGAGGGLVVGEIPTEGGGAPDTQPGEQVPGGGADPAPPVTPPPGPGTAPPAPPTAPPTTAAPPPSQPPTAPTTTTPPAPAPVIDRFTAVSNGFQCRAGLVYRVTWATSNADGVTVGSSAGQRQEAGPSGSVDLCVPRAESEPTFLLVATGPGGDAQQVISGRIVVP